MAQLVCLGSGMATTRFSYTTSFLLREKDGTQSFLIDCGGGNGILTRLAQANVATYEIDDVFVSHTHTDHIIGGIWLVRIAGHDYKRGLRKKPLQIYGEASVLETLKSLCRLLLPEESIVEGFGHIIRFRPVTDGLSKDIAGRKVTFFNTGATKVTQFGLKVLYNNISSLVFLGDEPYREVCAPYAKQANIIMHEAFCLETERPRYRPERINHSTAQDAGRLAEKIGAHNLILFHLRDGSPKERLVYEQEAKETFTGEVIAVNDLDIIDLEQFYVIRA